MAKKTLMQGIRRGADKPAAQRATPRDAEIHRHLSAAITNHRIPPGAPLPEDALSQAFGVSRTIIRKVLQQLAHERLVSLVPNKGASVARPTADEAREVFEARRAIERIIVERVVAKATDAEIAGLVAIAKAEQAAQDGDKRHQRVRMSGDFHRVLADLIRNSVLASAVNELIARTSLIIALYESPGAVPCSHSEHMEIADALRRRDARRAAEYMEHHLLHIEAQIELTDTHEAVDFSRLFSGN